jgi:hypothetical protein
MFNERGLSERSQVPEPLAMKWKAWLNEKLKKTQEENTDMSHIRFKRRQLV